MKKSEARQLRQLSTVAFTPTAPVKDQELFAGRIEQFRDLVDVMLTPGQHGVVYGERGVGKTSLAVVASKIFGTRERRSVRVNCATNDSFGSVCLKAIEKLDHQLPREIGFSRQTARSRGGPKRSSIGPGEVEAMLRRCTGEETSVAVFIDEFDRITDAEAHQMFADTIKGLSDDAVNATIVLIGVADDLTQLIAEHASIERALVQIHMPRMSPVELETIVKQGLKLLEMRIEPEALDHIVSLSQGLPHYTHLLAQGSVRAALERESGRVNLSDVRTAMEKAIKPTNQTLMRSYLAATTTPQGGTRYSEVMLAAALTPTDPMGYFAPGDIRIALETITKRDCPIRSYSKHLHELCNTERGEALQKSGSPRRYRFRFANPSMRPYVIMRALGNKQVEMELVDRFLGEGIAA